MRVRRTVEIPNQDVFQDVATREVVVQRLVGCDRVEGIADVQPSANTARHRQLRSPEQHLDLVLHLGDAERRTDGHEQRNLIFLRIELGEDVVRDHRALAVPDDDERAASWLQPLEHALAHQRPALRHEQVVVHVAHERPRQLARDPPPECRRQRQDVALDVGGARPGRA